MQVINSHIMILWELMMINMAVNNLGDIVVRAKAILQGIVLLLATPPKMVKTKNREGLHVEPQLIPLQKVSILVLVIVYSAISNCLNRRWICWTHHLFGFFWSSVCYLLPLSISRVAKTCIGASCLLSSCLFPFSTTGTKLIVVFPLLLELDAGPQLTPVFNLLAPIWLFKRRLS